MDKFGSLTSVLEQPQAARLADARARLVGLLRARGATLEMGELVASVAGGRWAHQIIRFVYNPPLAEFVSLTKTLAAEDYGRPFVELSPEKQALVKSRFELVSWDARSAGQQRAQAESSDFDRNPSNAAVRQKLWNLQGATTDAIDYVKRDLSHLARGELPDWAKPRGPVRLEDIYAFLKSKLEEFEAQAELLEATTNADLPSVLGRLIEPNVPIPISLASGFEEWLRAKRGTDDEAELRAVAKPPDGEPVTGAPAELPSASESLVGDATEAPVRTPASELAIRLAMREVYRTNDRPNVNDVVPLVQTLLGQEKLASKPVIQRIAGEGEFAVQRRKQGERKPPQS